MFKVIVLGLAVGTRGHTMVAGLLLGSVTQRLLHISPCPELAVPPAHANAAGKERTWSCSWPSSGSWA
jgi:Universal stress protein family